MIPPPVVAVVEAARGVIRARKTLQQAVASNEMNETGLRRLRAALRAEIKKLEASVVTLERLLAQAKKNRQPGTIPWASIFGAADKFLGLVTKIKAGDRTVVGDAARFVGDYTPNDRDRHPTKKSAADVIDGEFTEID